MLTLATELLASRDRRFCENFCKLGKTFCAKSTRCQIVQAESSLFRLGGKKQFLAHIKTKRKQRAAKGEEVYGTQAQKPRETANKISRRTWRIRNVELAAEKWPPDVGTLHGQKATHGIVSGAYVSTLHICMGFGYIHMRGLRLYLRFLRLRLCAICFALN